MDEKKKVVLGDEDFTVNQENSAQYNATPDPNITPEDDKVEDESLLSSLMRRRRERSSQVFNEDKEKELAKEATKNVPPAIIEKTVTPEEETGIDTITDIEYQDEYKNENVRDAEYVEDFTKGKVNLTDREKSELRRKRRLIGAGISALLFALLFWFAPLIQKALFQSKGNSYIFRSQPGFWGPRMGIILIALGIVGIMIVLFSFFGKNRPSLLKKNVIPSTRTVLMRRIGIAMSLLLLLGITNLFNFSEFRGNDVRFSSFFNGNDLKDYNNVSNQNVSLVGNDIVYEIVMGNKSTSFAINQVDKNDVKTLDSKMNPDRKVTIDNNTFQEIIRKGFYNEKEAYEVYKYKVPQQ